MIHVISLGAGVQSSAMALMFAAGELEPLPDVCIFADVGAEPQYVYDYLDYLEGLGLPFPIKRVMWKAGLLENIKDSIKGARFAGAPFYTESDGLREGQLRRQCTREFKVQPITQELRRMVGLKYRQRAPKKILVTQYIGISLDESIRMRPSRNHWIEHKWPLVDIRMRRQDCLDWLAANGYKLPGRSACTFCPYHSDREWHDLKTNHPAAFQAAVKVDNLIRNGVRGTTQKLYLHRTMKPINEVRLQTAAAVGQADLFNNECEGMCGV